MSALLFLAGEMHAMASERAQYVCQGRRWLQLSIALLSLATAMLQLQFQSQASSCIQQVDAKPPLQFVQIYYKTNLITCR